LEINLTLLREKFTISDLERQGEPPLVAVSNRLALPLQDARGQVSETVVVRTQTMHNCIRMGAQILRTFSKEGPIFVRAERFNFQDAWDRSCSDFDVVTNPNRWCGIYHRGSMEFSSGNYHGFLDVIEKCESKNPGNYDQSVRIAEETFKKMGRQVSIKYEANIAMVLSVKQDIGRCGLIHRGSEKSSTFNFIAESSEDSVVSGVSCLNNCAAFLEGLQLAYKVGSSKDRLKLGLIDLNSHEMKQTKLALRRLNELGTEVENFENRLRVRYRPEKPDFHQIIMDAERIHRKRFESSQ
jgi:hypothetical protein